MRLRLRFFQRNGPDNGSALSAFKFFTVEFVLQPELLAAVSAFHIEWHGIAECLVTF